VNKNLLVVGGVWINCLGKSWNCQKVSRALATAQSPRHTFPHFSPPLSPTFYHHLWSCR